MPGMGAAVSRTRFALLGAIHWLGCAACSVGADTPLESFVSDAHTVFLYHCDEGQGSRVRDSGPHGYEAEVRGAQWTPGRFGSALRFDGEDDSVFREVPEAACGLTSFTIECWFQPHSPQGRRFLAGQDVGFHFEVDDGASSSLSLYNEGGGVPNADGVPHRQVGAPTGPLRLGRWHHLAATYDGDVVSFFVDGALTGRMPAARDFRIGVPSRGLWIGCYVGMDYWFSGLIDEVRLSDCVRYDPERALAPGGRVFDMPVHRVAARAVRVPRETGKASLDLTLRQIGGGTARGFVCLKPPGSAAVAVGEYSVGDRADGDAFTSTLDVSDEVAGPGAYILGLEPTDASAYFAVVGAVLRAGDRVLAEWAGEARSRRTFLPPVLVPLTIGDPSPAAGDLVLLPAQADRTTGDLEFDTDVPDLQPTLLGRGWIEHWVRIDEEATYRVHLRYAAAAPRPCDIVIDGADLNRFDMCALNSTASLGVGADAAQWEYQGTVRLTPGLHWIRLQDELPEVSGLWLQPAAPRPTAVSWARFGAPEPDFAAVATDWRAVAAFGDVREATAESDGHGTLSLSCVFANADPGRLAASDRARFSLEGQWDLEPFGRLRFGLRGSGSGHVVAVWAIDSKGDERLLWRGRDESAGVVQVSAPLSWEGNDVFDPGRAVALCIDLDEGNARARAENRFAVQLADLAFDRRDEISLVGDYTGALIEARAALAAVLGRTGPAADALRSPGFRPWAQPVVPERHPLFAATEPKPVTRETLGYGLHFTGARGVDPATLDQFHVTYGFGDVCWPHIGILPLREKYASDAEYDAAMGELESRLEDVARRGLYLFDIWGYVPDMPEYPWRVAPEHIALLQRVLGDRFLGCDNGEQDGRYIGAYADRDPHTNRREGWDSFVRWDQRIAGDNGNYINATGSLNFSHYYGERGARTLGLETAQGLPSDTLMFAFLRGASKQYGRLTTQATSVWNRYGYNIYSDRRTEGANGYGLGPSKGCSLSLHKRLMLSSYSGGDSIVGTETAQFTADATDGGAPELSPLGAQHLSIRQWADTHTDRGVMYTPVAFMLDFHSGWTVPRHLYRGDKYKVWGKLPYEKGDHLADNVFRMVWPGYEDCSYLRNERGFLTPTPYGDCFDVITNRCHPDVLSQYTSIVLLGDVELPPDVVGHLGAFVRAGGDLILDAPRARILGAELAGLTVGDAERGVLSHVIASGETYDEDPYTYARVQLAAALPLVVGEHGDALVTVNRVGEGRAIVVTPDYWMTDALPYRNPELVNMEPPYRVLRGVREVLDAYFASFCPVTVEPAGLNVRVNCFEADDQRLLVTLMNNELFADWSGVVRIGRDVVRATDIWYGAELAPGREMPLTIPAGDVAVLDLRLE